MRHSWARLRRSAALSSSEISGLASRYSFARRYALTYGVLFQIRDDLADGADSPELLALQAEYEALLAKDPVAARI